MLVTSSMSLGILSIQTIGMHVACCGILSSLFEDISVQSSPLSDRQDVVVHTAARMPSALAAQAEAARKAKASRDRGGSGAVGTAAIAQGRSIVGRVNRSSPRAAAGSKRSGYPVPAIGSPLATVG